MGRPHIEFIQAQNLPWHADLVVEARPGVDGKLLSRDDGTGALSCLLRYPQGWHRRTAEHLDADEELYVIDGALTINGVRYGEHTYCHLPVGFHRDGMSSEGAVVLTFFSKTPIAAPGRAPDGLYDPRRLVEKLTIADNVWDGDFEKMGLGSMRDIGRMRTLRTDPVTGEITYLTATIAFRQGVRAERHPVVQEFFMLSGELAGEYGVMQAGAYCWRPPMVKHGPYGSPTGTLIVFRAVGGPLTTLWEDAEPFTYSPPHRPILPPDLAPLGARPAPRPARY